MSAPPTSFSIAKSCCCRSLRDWWSCRRRISEGNSFSCWIGNWNVLPLSSQGFGGAFISQRFLKPSLQSLTLDRLGYGGPAEVLVFEDGNRLSLIVAGDDGLVLLASLVRQPKMPLLIVGDYQGFESRQLAFWF